MTQKESEEHIVDYEFISKYIRDNSPKNCKDDEKSEKMSEEKKHGKTFLADRFASGKSGAIEVFGSIGEGESYTQERSNFNKWHKKEEEFGESDKNTKFSSKPITGATAAKQEFLKHIEDESLSLDTCSSINHDWKME